MASVFETCLWRPSLPRLCCLVVMFLSISHSIGQSTESVASQSVEAKTAYHPLGNDLPLRTYQPVQHQAPPLSGSYPPPGRPQSPPGGQYQPPPHPSNDPVRADISSPVVPHWPLPLRPPSGVNNAHASSQQQQQQQQQQLGPPPSGSNTPSSMPMMTVTNTEIACHGVTMQVQITLSIPFHGVVYPYGQYSRCVLFEGRGERVVSLTLGHGVCGNQRPDSSEAPLNPHLEHRLMVQWDPEIVEEWDSSVIVRCDRPQDYNKTIGFNLGTLELKSDVFSGTHAGPHMFMQIEKGEGPGAPQLSGAVYLGQPLTLVFTLSHEHFTFDSNVLACWAFDGKSERPRLDWLQGGPGPSVAGSGPGNSQLPPAPVQSYRRSLGELQIIRDGCSVRPKVFGHFSKVPPHGSYGGTGHTLTQFVHFKAFRFPTSDHLTLQCSVQVCYRRCPLQRPCDESYRPRQAAAPASAAGRRRRSADDHDEDSDEWREAGEQPADQSVNMMREIRVLLAEADDEPELDARPVTRRFVGSSGLMDQRDCYSVSTLFVGLVLLAVLLAILLAVILRLGFRGRGLLGRDKLSMDTPTK